MKHIFKIIAILLLLCGNSIAQGLAEQIQAPAIPPPSQDSIAVPPQGSVAVPPQDSVAVPPQDSVAVPPQDSIIVPKQDSVAQPAQTATPALKECDALFNAEKKFCYDGGVYDKCDGIIYNPTTHICSGDVAHRAVCNEAQYNPLTQKCENNAVVSIQTAVPPAQIIAPVTATPETTAPTATAPALTATTASETAIQWQVQSGVAQEAPQSKSFWTAKNTIRILAFGLSAASAGLGFWQNKVMETKAEDMNNFYRQAHGAYNTPDYRGKYESFQNSADEVKNSKNLRNGFYIGAGVLSFAGVVTFFF